MNKEKTERIERLIENFFKYFTWGLIGYCIYYLIWFILVLIRIVPFYKLTTDIPTTLWSLITIISVILSSAIIVFLTTKLKITFYFHEVEEISEENNNAESSEEK